MFEVIKCFLISIYKQSAWITSSKAICAQKIICTKLFAGTVDQPIKICDRNKLNDDIYIFSN